MKGIFHSALIGDAKTMRGKMTPKIIIITTTRPLGLLDLKIAVNVAVTDNIDSPIARRNGVVINLQVLIF